MQTQGHAGGNSSSASCPGKKGPANQNSESEVHIGIRNEEADKVATAATVSATALKNMQSVMRACEASTGPYRQ